jgi:NADH dehydrogenase (ubiquinone) 1 alpha subcomplex subunit 13
MTETTVRGIKGMKTVMEMPVMQVRLSVERASSGAREATGAASRRPPSRARRSASAPETNPDTVSSIIHRPLANATDADIRASNETQDGPPPGGYPSVRYARRIPSTGPTGLAFFGAYLGAMVYGFYQVGQGNARRRGLKEEKLNARAVLIPFLQAEEDRRYVASVKERQKSEDKIMAGVPGWKSGDQGAVYNTTWLPPQHTYAPKMI